MATEGKRPGSVVLRSAFGPTTPLPPSDREGLLGTGLRRVAGAELIKTWAEEGESISIVTPGE